MAENPDKPIPQWLWVGLSLILSQVLLIPFFFLTYDLLHAYPLADTYFTLATVALVILVTLLFVLLLVEVAVVRRTWLQLFLIISAMFVAVVATTKLSIFYYFLGLALTPLILVSPLLFGIYLVAVLIKRWSRQFQLAHLLALLIFVTLFAVSTVAYEQLELSFIKRIASMDIEGRHFHAIAWHSLSDGTTTMLLECNSIGMACQLRYRLDIYSDNIRLETEEGPTPGITLFADNQPVYHEDLK
ncbi:MAG: hypothetical protein H6672_21485 [Anaerolineaceae bacterium]|nr:hypothetical protein [Anaerolineaceae bacterium]